MGSSFQYAKDEDSPDNIYIRITAYNRGPDPANLHIIPQFWFPNTWSWGLPPHGLLQFMTSSGRHTYIVFRPLLLSNPTVNPSTTVPKVKTRWIPNCCSPRTTRTSCACGASRISLLSSRTHSTTISSRCIDHWVTKLLMDDPRRALTAKTTTSQTEVTPSLALDVPLQFLPAVLSLSILIRLEPSPLRTTALGMSLAEAGAL